MKLTQSSPDRPGAENLLLARLAPADRKRLSSHLKYEEFAFRQTVYESGAAIRHVYFPLTSIVAVVTQIADKRSMEVTTMGSEGMVGLPVVWGVPTAMFRIVVQVPGLALRMETEQFQTELQRSSRLRELFGRYTFVRLAQIGQSVGCNGLHSVKQRCGRWLLQTHDRIQAEQFPLSQTYFAHMLGVRRASVAEVARTLEREGSIRYRGGTVTILDRRSLEAASCPCYRIVRDDYERVLGAGRPPG